MSDQSGGGEPIAISEAVRAVVVATGSVLTLFNVWNPTPEQFGGVLALYGAVSVMLSVFARLRSTPTSKVALTKDQVTKLQS